MQKHVHLIIALLWLLAAVLVPAFIASELDIAGVRAWTIMHQCVRAGYIDTHGIAQLRSSSQSETTPTSDEEATRRFLVGDHIRIALDLLQWISILFLGASVVSFGAWRLSSRKPRQSSHETTPPAA